MCLPQQQIQRLKDTRLPRVVVPDDQIYAVKLLEFKLLEAAKVGQLEGFKHGVGREPDTRWNAVWGEIADEGVRAPAG